MSYFVDWSVEFRRLFRRVGLDSVDVSELLNEFRGYEEALWLSTCSRYGVDALDGVNKAAFTSKTREQLLRFRIMKIYCRYQPSKLQDVDAVVKLAMQDPSEQAIIFRLVSKYGPEPTDVDATVRDRVTMWFAFYRRWDRLETVDRLLAAFDGHSDALMHRLEEELGPEPSPGMCVDPRDPRARLLRILEHYDPSSLPRLDYMLVHNQGNYIKLFGSLQRRFGREPEPEEQQESNRPAGEKRSRVHSVAISRLLDDAELEAKRLGQLAAKVSDAAEASTSGFLTSIDKSVTFRRHPSINLVRKMIRDADVYSPDELLHVTKEVFQGYNRLLYHSADAMVVQRFSGEINESIEWLSFLDFMFTNERPLSTEPTLREVASLIDIERGGRVEEFMVAGGVEAFLRGTDAHSAVSWIQYLRTVYGMPEESKIATHNRWLAHYLHYNPGKSRREAELELHALASVSPFVGSLLEVRYGAEPQAPPVPLDRVTNILSRHAHHKLTRIEDVIEAHCLPGDSAEAVVRRIERTYGPELRDEYPQLEALAANEFANRFRCFVSELRMRDVLGRRFAAILGRAADIHTVLEQHVASKLELQVKRVRQQQHEHEQRQKRLAEERQLVDLEKDKLFHQESDARAEITEEETDAFEDLTMTAATVLDKWDESRNIELAEALRRQRLHEEFLFGLIPLGDQMVAEGSHVMAFVESRSVWRKKWLADDYERNQRLEARVLSLQEEAAAAERLRHQAALVGSVFSSAREHDRVMKERFQQLNEQAVRVLQYDVELQHARHRVRADGLRAAATIASSRGLHDGCRFHDRNYVSAVVSRQQLDKSGDTAHSHTWDTAPTDASAPNVGNGFGEQVAEYLAQLFERYEPARLGTEADLVSQYHGREAQLITALEQKYNVNHVAERQLRARLQTYIQARAPHLKDDVDVILQRFGGNEEALWRFMANVYGPAPHLQPHEMRLYLKNRLTKYLQRRAPHLLLEADMMVDRCEDNGDALFERLTAEFGEEDPDERRSVLERKLRSFYKRRNMRRSLESVSLLASRFAGRETMLRKLLVEKFGESFEGEIPDADDLLL